MKLRLLSSKGKKKIEINKESTPPQTINNGTGVEVSLTPVAKKDPLLIGNVDEPRGIAKLTMLMKGKSGEDEKKRKMREDPE